MSIYEDTAALTVLDDRDLSSWMLDDGFDSFCRASGHPDEVEHLVNAQARVLTDLPLQAGAIVPVDNAHNGPPGRPPLYA